MTKEQIAVGLDEIAANIPKDSPAGIVAYGLLHLGAMMLRQGKDPVSHLSRIKDLNPDFDAASNAADAAAFGKFHGDPEPPPEGANQ